MSELLPCPFCGAMPVSSYSKFDWYGQPPHYVGRCRECGAAGPISTEPTLAFTRWNRRPIEDALRTSPWWSVADDPPPDEVEEIFAIDCKGRLGIAEKAHDGEGPPVWECWVGEDWFEAIWWMPVPAPPEEVEE